MTSPIDPAVHAVQQLVRARDVARSDVAELSARLALVETSLLNEVAKRKADAQEADQLRAKLREAGEQREKLALTLADERSAHGKEANQLRAKLAEAERERDAARAQSGSWRAARDEMAAEAERLRAELAEARRVTDLLAPIGPGACNPVPVQQPSEAPLSRGELVRALREAPMPQLPRKWFAAVADWLEAADAKG